MPSLSVANSCPRSPHRLFSSRSRAPHSRQGLRTILHLVVGPRGQVCIHLHGWLDAQPAPCSDALVTSGCTGDEGAEPTNGATHGRDFGVTSGFSIPTLPPSIKFKPRPLRTKWHRARPNRIHAPDLLIHGSSSAQGSRPISHAASSATHSFILIHAAPPHLQRR